MLFVALVIYSQAPLPYIICSQTGIVTVATEMFKKGDRIIAGDADSLLPTFGVHSNVAGFFMLYAARAMRGKGLIFFWRIGTI